MSTKLHNRTTLARLQFVLACVRDGGFTGGQIARRWECSRKAIYRDMDFLKDFFGYPISYDAKAKAYRMGAETTRRKLLLDETESIRWIDSSQALPDADLTVLVDCPGEDEPIWLGYWAGEEWRNIEGDSITPARWAEMPTGGRAC